MRPESEMIRELLEGQTVIVVSHSRTGKIEIEPMIKINRVDGGSSTCIFCENGDAGAYTGNEFGDVDYKDRSITFYEVAESILTRTFVVVNLDGNTGKKYRNYANDAEHKLWMAAEDESNERKTQLIDSINHLL